PHRRGGGARAPRDPSRPPRRAREPRRPVLEDLLHPAGDPQDRQQRVPHALQGEGGGTMSLAEAAAPREAAQGTGKAVTGVAIAIVTKNQDPDGEGRVQVRYPWY